MIAGEKLNAALGAYDAKDYALAISEAKAALALDAMAHKGHQIIATSLRDQGDWDGSVEAIEAALKIAPRDAECLNTYGSTLAALNRDFDAIETFKRALEIAPNYLQPALGLGQVYLMRNNPIEAADVFQNALAHSPEHPVLLKGLLFALNDAQQFEVANNLLGKIPVAPDTAHVSGQIALARRQRPVAEAHFVRALSHPPSSMQAFRSLVEMNWTDEEGAENGAVKFIYQFIEDNPKAGPLYLYGAELLAEGGEFEPALDLINRAEATFGNNPDIQYVKAKALTAAGQGRPALECANNAVQARPGDLSALFQFSRAALMAGEPEVALQSAQMGEQGQPKNQFWVAAQATAFRALGRDEDYTHLYNYGDVKSYDLAPPPEYNTREDFLEKLKDALLKRHQHQPFVLGQSHEGGTRTNEIRFADDRVIQDFFQSLAAPLAKYIAEMSNDNAHPFYARKRKSFRISEAWSVNLDGEGFHMNHIDPDGWVSAVFYVDVPKDIETRQDKAGWIAFGKPPFLVRGQEGKPLNAEHMVAPAAGRLVLFPSYMWQGTVPLPEGDNNCLSLSFKALPA